MKLNWFTRKGIIYQPISLTGWIILAAALAYAVYSFIDINRRSQPGSDTVINFVFNLLVIGLGYTLIAFFAEKKPENAAG